MGGQLGIIIGCFTVHVITRVVFGERRDGTVTLPLSPLWSSFPRGSQQI